MSDNEKELLEHLLEYVKDTNLDAIEMLDDNKVFIDNFEKAIANLPSAPHEMTAREFVRQFQRMCQSTKECCSKSDCPFHEVDDSEYVEGAITHTFNCTPDVWDVNEVVDIVEQWAAAHPERKRKTYAEDFIRKFPNTKIYKEENRPWFCRKEIYEGKTGYCGGYSKGECCACWNEEMEDEDET